MIELYAVAILKFGALSRNRTDHLRITKPLLYQMSYEGNVLYLAALSACSLNSNSLA